MRGQGDQNRKGKRRKLKARLKKLEREMIILQKQVAASDSLHAITIRKTLLPLICGVVYKAIYETGMKQATKVESWEDRRLRHLRENRARFMDFEMRTLDEMEMFTDTVSAAML